MTRKSLSKKHVEAFTAVVCTRLASTEHPSITRNLSVMHFAFYFHVENLQLTQQAMAELCGVSVTGIKKTMNTLSDDGLLEASAVHNSIGRGHVYQYALPADLVDEVLNYVGPPLLDRLSVRREARAY